MTAPSYHALCQAHCQGVQTHGENSRWIARTVRAPSSAGSGAADPVVDGAHCSDAATARLA